MVPSPLTTLDGHWLIAGGDEGNLRLWSSVPFGHLYGFTSLAHGGATKFREDGVYFGMNCCIRSASLISQSLASRYALRKIISVR